MTKVNWNQPGTTLSDKSARAEYGLTQEEIVNAVRDGKLQFRENHIHGNPYLRLLRNEVEKLSKRLRGGDGFARQKLLAELKSFESQIRSCKSKIRKLEKQKEMVSNELAQLPSTS
jgi:septal ring factor EnvC (AmiA/AmiB activator)